MLLCSFRLAAEITRLPLLVAIERLVVLLCLVHKPHEVVRITFEGLSKLHQRISAWPRDFRHTLLFCFFLIKDHLKAMASRVTALKKSMLIAVALALLLSVAQELVRRFDFLYAVVNRRWWFWAVYRLRSLLGQNKVTGLSIRDIFLTNWGNEITELGLSRWS